MRYTTSLGMQGGGNEQDMRCVPKKMDTPETVIIKPVDEQVCEDTRVRRSVSDSRGQN
jgi:hypothetical protein